MKKAVDVCKDVHDMESCSVWERSRCSQVLTSVQECHSNPKAGVEGVKHQGSWVVKQGAVLVGDGVRITGCLLARVED